MHRSKQVEDPTSIVWMYYDAVALRYSCRGQGLKATRNQTIACSEANKLERCFPTRWGALLGLRVPRSVRLVNPPTSLAVIKNSFTRPPVSHARFRSPTYYLIAVRYSSFSPTPPLSPPSTAIWRPPPFSSTVFHLVLNAVICPFLPLPDL